jgi:hypothetical protein
MLTSGLIAGKEAANAVSGGERRKEKKVIKEKTSLRQKQDLSSDNKKIVNKQVLAKEVNTVCNLCALTCEMLVTFGDTGSLVSLTGAQCESGKVFVEQNKAILMIGDL